MTPRISVPGPVSPVATGWLAVRPLGLRDATVTAQGITVHARAGEVEGDAIFHVAVPARRWWDDIGYT